MGNHVEIRPLDPSQAAWAAAVLTGHFGSARVVSRGRPHDTSTLPGLVAQLGDDPAGLLHYRIEDEIEYERILVAPPGA